MTPPNISAGLYRHLTSAISELCAAAYREANPPGQRRRKPYAVPELAAAMVRALDADDADEAKRLMLLYRTGSHSLA